MLKLTLDEVRELSSGIKKFIKSTEFILEGSLNEKTRKKTKTKTKKTQKGVFLGVRKLLFVSFCVVVWVLFSVFSIFCITSLVSATPRNHHKKKKQVQKSKNLFSSNSCDTLFT